MNILSIFSSFLFLWLTIVSNWIKKAPLVSLIFLGLSIIFALISNIITLVGLIFIMTLITLWLAYKYKSNNVFFKMLLFLTIIAYSLLFSFHLVPGFNNLQISAKLFLSFDKILTGLLPLLLVVSLASKIKDWQLVFTKGLIISLIGIGIMTILALISKTVQLEFKLPSHTFLRYFYNLFFVVIPEEGLYRGFIQKQLTNFLKKIPGSKYISLIITALIFTLSHLYWAPNIGIFAFVFLAGILYGYVYLKVNLESAMLCHFLLNFIHMTFFSYHAI